MTCRSTMSENVWFTRCWKEAGALVSPNGMTRYSNDPYWQRKAVFHSSPFAIQMWLYAFRRSIFVKILASRSRSRSSPMRGRGYLFLMVILLRPR